MLVHLGTGRVVKRPIVSSGSTSGISGDARKDRDKPLASSYGVLDELTD